MDAIGKSAGYTIVSRSDREVVKAIKTNFISISE
jgi:hypothetical protein